MRLDLLVGGRLHRNASRLILVAAVVVIARSTVSAIILAVATIAVVVILAISAHGVVVATANSTTALLVRVHQVVRIVLVATVAASTAEIVVPIANENELIRITNTLTSTATGGPVAHLPATASGHAKRLAIDLALVTPVGAILALRAIGGRLARNVVEERFRLVVADHGARRTGHHFVVLLLVLTGTGLVARIVFLIRFTVHLYKQIRVLLPGVVKCHTKHASCQNCLR